MHKKASEYAAENGYSLNQVVSMAMEAFLGNQAKGN
jgi:predicted HicB family RNase H-like nuclease